MRFPGWFRNRRSSERQLHELYQSAEEGVPLPGVTPEAREQFEADQHLIDQLSDLASSAGPTDAALQRGALLSRVAEQRKGRRVEEGIPVFGRLFQKRTLAAAGAAIVLLGAAATVGAAGGVSDVAGSVGDVLGVLQITAGESNVEICHVPEDNPDNPHTISVGESAVDEHIAHGDAQGACADETSPGAPDSTGSSDNVEVCHGPEDNVGNAHTISIAESALEDHLAHGDTQGACEDETSPGAPDGTGPSDRVDVCHGPEDNQHTLSVPQDALDEHLAHGDTQGACEGETSPGAPDGAGPSDRVDVCHGPEDNQHTLSVPEGTLDEHLAHGDTEGVCEGDETRNGPPADVPNGPSTDVPQGPPDSVPQGPPDDRPPA